MCESKEEEEVEEVGVGGGVTGDIYFFFSVSSRDCW